MTEPDPLLAALERHRGRFAPVLAIPFAIEPPTVFDFTSANRDLEHVGIHDAVTFTEYLFGRIVAQGTPFGIGRYDEDRVLYRHSPLFDSHVEQRSIHLGIDLFVAEGTPVHAPLAGAVHSFADNDRLGDYGPTVILEHRLDGIRFFTLYGHLARPSLEPLEPGAQVARAEQFAWVGDHRENGGWPPHLHFQIIRDLEGWRGDFPGVAAASERSRWLHRCPDPNLILGIPGL